MSFKCHTGDRTINVTLIETKSYYFLNAGRCPDNNNKLLSTVSTAVLTAVLISL